MSIKYIQIKIDKGIRLVSFHGRCSCTGPTPDPLLNWVTEPVNVSANQRWVLLTSLKAATSYQFRVSAVNTVGEGPASDPTDVLTLAQEGKMNLIFRVCF